MSDKTTTTTAQTATITTTTIITTTHVSMSITQPKSQFCITNFERYLCEF
jgi:hypothetical protein